MLTMIAFSLSSANPILGQEKPPEEPPEEPPWWKGEQFNGTFIFWDTEQEVSEESWSWINQAWEFGPYPTFAIYLLNGTEVTNTNFIPLGEPFKVVIDVKKTIFTGNMTLGRAGLNWHTELRAKNGSETGFARCRMVYINQIVTPYWNESDTWHIESFVFNESEVLAPPEEGFTEQLVQNWWIFVLIGSVAAVAVILVVFRAKVKSGLLRLRQSIGSVLHRGKGAKGPSPEKPPRLRGNPKNLG